MVFPFRVAIDTTEVRDEAVAATLAAKGIGVMLIVTMLALALGLPSLQIESFPSWQPILTQFLRPSRDKMKCFTFALGTLGALLLPCDGLLMVFRQMIAETIRLAP
jgi:hypothetical protein